MISINTSCTRCYRCTKVCPAGIFAVARDSNEKQVQIRNEHRCIDCGHCVAACGDNAIIHKNFPEDKVHFIERTQLPTPEQILLLMRKRRSNRVFSSKAIPEEYFLQILEAAHRAPTARNLQFVEFTLVTDPQKLNLITEFTLDTFLSQIKKIDNPVLRPIFKRLFPDLFKFVPQFKNIQKIYEEQGKDIGILRGATAVLLIHTSKPTHYGSEDCNLAYQNASLMAEGLGVSQFYTGFVLRAIKGRKNKLEKLLGINGTIHAGMALGMPMFEYPNYIDRKDIVVKRF